MDLEATTSDSLPDHHRTLAKFGFWPSIPMESDPEAWLGNFLDEELPVAQAMLNAFTFIPERATIQMLKAAFRGVALDGHSPLQIAARSSLSKWHGFLNSTLITYPTGETPSPTDSGHLLARWCRDELEFPETNIVSPDTAVEILASDPTRPLVITDDFAGSGDQFMKTWHRQYKVGASTHSLAEVAHETDVYYVAPVMAWMAGERIAKEAPGVHISSCHYLKRRYSVLDANSALIPEGLRDDMRRVVAAASSRAGIPPAYVHGWRELGLALSFSHTKTDAALGIFWIETPTWKALLPKWKYGFK